MSLGADPARAALDARVIAWTRDPFRRDEARFDALARDLFAHQFARCEPYRRFCEGRGVTPRTVARHQDVPPVPTGAFKELELLSFPEARKAHVFRTSGTTTERRGALWLDTLDVYEASLLPTFERYVLPDLRGRVRTLVLAPSADEVPDSSLSHMFGALLAHRGDGGSGFFVTGGRLRTDALCEGVETACAEDVPVLLAGTALSFVHLLDALEASGRRFALPHGSRIMETGGFKGRARETERGDLCTRIDELLGVPTERVVNQYGMTELASQFYDAVLAEPGGPHRKLGPPWARVHIVGPGSGRPCGEGETGAITVYDLANTGSVLAIQTADLGRVVGEGFEVVGREPGAEARGCSIAADAMLLDAAP